MTSQENDQTPATAAAPASAQPPRNGSHDFGDDAKARTVAIGAPTREAAASVVIVVIAILTAFFAIQLFYAAQLHVRIAEMQLNGVSINIWRTAPIKDKILNWQKRIFKLEEKLVELREVQDKAIRYATIQQSDAEVAAANLRDKVASAVLTLGLDDALDQDNTTNATLVKLFGLIREKTKAEPENPSWQLLGREIEAAYEELSAKRKAAQAADDYVTLAKAEVTNADEIKKGTEAESKRLFGLSSNDVGPELIERINNIVTEIDQASSSLVPLVDGRSLIYWPTENLVLALVLTMGILGSCLHLMAERFATSAADRPTQEGAARISFGQALLRLFYGGVMALVVYLVAKASVPILTDTSRIGGQAPLNPYFISFVGIISGLASERAIQSLRGVGESIFPSGDALAVRPRYATPMLAEELDRQDLGNDALAEYLGLPAGATADAVAGRRAVTPSEQAIMAAFLRADARVIFSDLKSAQEGDGEGEDQRPPPASPRG